MQLENVDTFYPLSPLQEGLLFHSLAAPQSGVHFNQCIFELRGDLDVDALQRAWQHVTDRHPVLRTFFVWEDLQEPVQVVNRTVSISFQVLDWRDLPGKEQNARLDEVLRSMRRQGFDLTQPPLMRFDLVRTADDRHEFIWSHHHLLLDGWSMFHVLQEAFASYDAFREGREAPSFGPARPYRDHIAWLRQQDIRQAEAYWRERLRGFTAPTPLVVDRVSPDGTAPAHESASELVLLDAASTAALQAVARQHHVTLNTVIQLAWAVVLSRYSGERDVVFGTVVSGRSPELDGFESMVGLFINTLPVRVTLPEGVTGREALRTLQRQLAETRQYEFSPLVQVQGWSEAPRNRPLFESILLFENYRKEATLEQMSTSLDIRNARWVEGTNYPLVLLAEPGERLQLRLLYHQHRFDEGTVRRMLGHVQSVLTGMVANVNGPLDAVPVLTPAERVQLVVEWNDTATDYPLDRCLHQLIEAQTARTPDAVAVVAEGGALTYAQLDVRANQVAHHLRALGVGRDVLVGICLERSLELVVGLLAILKAGGAYAPLDPSYPVERLAFMLDDMNAPVLLTQEGLLGQLPPFAGATVCLDRDAPIIAVRPHTAPPCPATPDSLAYVIYTSGSTGKPKGAMNTHRGICNRLFWMQDEYRLQADDRVMQKTPISFDVSVWEFFWPLMTGARLVMARPGGHRDSEYLTQLIADAAITTLHFVPSMLQMFLEAPRLDRCRSLRRVICSGEALPPALVERFFDRIDAELHNLYGPTEAAVDVTFWPCARDPECRTVPIGRPIANTQIYLLDADLSPTPIGVPGELYIGGVNVGRGYYNRPDLTAERFVRDPFSTAPDARLYRTGDLARYQPGGAIEYLGRLDHQVKLRGMRVELGEIEAVLAEHPAVQEATVILREQGPEDQRLVAYIVPDREQAPVILRLLRMEADGQLPSGARYDLPNGMTVCHLNKGETDFLYQELFVQEGYLRHGITLDDGACVFDVGANIGLFSLFIGRAYRDAQIYAFEPIPPVFRVLEANASLYGLNAKVFDCGLSNRARTETFTYYPHLSIISGQFAERAEEREVVKSFMLSSAGPGEVTAADAPLLDTLIDDRLSSERFECRLRTVSEVIAECGVERIDLLKVDVEKGELDVLAGVADEDWTKIRQVVVEVHDMDGRLEYVKTLLTSRGFHLVVEQDEALRGTALYNIYASRDRIGGDGTRAVEGRGRERAQKREAEGARHWDSVGRLTEDLQRFLRDRLPAYMVPATFVSLERFPLSPNGKIDRRALPAPQYGRAKAEDTFVAPSNPFEEGIAEIWRDVLKVERVGIDDDFFELGGHSLLAARVFARLDRAFGRSLPLATLFSAPTVRALARFYHDEAETAEGTALTPMAAGGTVLVTITPGGTLPPVFAVPGIGGNVVGFATLARNLGADQPFFGLQSAGLDGAREPFESIEEMAGHYVHEVRQLQPHGPYYLLGACFGATVAFEMTRQLLDAGEEVGLLGLLDPSSVGGELADQPELPLPGWFKRGRVAASFVANRLRRYREKMGALDYRERARFVGSKLKIVGEIAQRREFFQDHHREFRQRRVNDANLRALLRYKHEPLTGGANTVEIFGTERHFDPLVPSSVEWTSLAGGPHHEVQGNNSGDMLQGENASLLASLLSVRLQHARRAAPGHTVSRATHEPPRPSSHTWRTSSTRDARHSEAETR